ncbi:MAG: carbohydrate kinase [Microbacterium sp.]|uniref:carbohydrate kinase family protein n=1 Tax=Microbacterium sp. TaxID=51671 RepID=UPI001AC1B907|nr:carbohydrate kinase [Microbacterium sp.]MBN9178693.1 carbohydrate kinase [Microbacterium sp.]
MPAPHAPAVLVIGEALMDITVTGDETVETPGGGPANIALGLARRDVDAALLTRLGDDERGRAIARHLEASGVGILPESFHAGTTSTARATLDERGAATYDFDISWDVPADVAVGDVPVIHTGSLGVFLEPGADTVAAVLDAHPDAVITFDPNIRPGLVGDPDAARERFEAIARRATVVKLSDEDAAYLFAIDSVDAVIDAILALGPALVAVTRGGDGATLSTREHRVEVDAPRVDVVDTIGAGDTFMASLLAEPAIRAGAELDGDDLAAIGRRAVAAAAVTVSRTGADLPWASELDA